MRFKTAVKTPSKKASNILARDNPDPNREQGEQVGRQAEADTASHKVTIHKLAMVKPEILKAWPTKVLVIALCVLSFGAGWASSRSYAIQQGVADRACAGAVTSNE